MKSQSETIRLLEIHVHNLELSVAGTTARIEALEARLEAIEKPQPVCKCEAFGGFEWECENCGEPVMDKAIVWPEYPKRCNCGNFEEDFEAGTMSCIHCGGLMF